MLIQQNVQGLLVNSRVRELDFCLRFLRGVDNRRATNLGEFLAVAVKSPTADFVVTDQVLDEQNASVETKRELVEEFDIFQQVVV